MSLKFQDHKLLFLAHSRKTVSNVSPDVIYNFKFVSLISPKFVKSISLTSTESPDTSNNPSSKLFLKQSYLLLTWLYYLTFIQLQGQDNKNLRFAFLPTRKKHYTLTKAPMAHKTNSKEQFMFRFYHLRITFKAQFTNQILPAQRDHDFALYSLYLLKSTFPAFETNSMFLKACSFHLRFSLSKYLNLRHFLNSKKNL